MWGEVNRRWTEIKCSIERQFEVWKGGNGRNRRHEVQWVVKTMVTQTNAEERHTGDG
jgi:hypothetical protein